MKHRVQQHPFWYSSDVMLPCPFGPSDQYGTATASGGSRGLCPGEAGGDAVRGDALCEELDISELDIVLIMALSVSSYSYDE